MHSLTWKQPKILVVDDDGDLREALAEVLHQEGYETLCCEDGAVALAHLRSTEHLPVLIVLDLMMPVMNGWEFRDEQLRDAALRSIPVVAMTANRGILPLPNVRTMLLKPFRIGDLLEVIDQYRREGLIDAPSEATLDRASDAVS